jgi:hypothetical protein
VDQGSHRLIPLESDRRAKSSSHGSLPVVRPPSRREKHDALGLLLGMLGILLGLALTAGATLPSAQ